jgi:hypothetical protein
MVNPTVISGVSDEQSISLHRRGDRSTSTARGVLSITPDDDVELARVTRALYVGVTGDVEVVMVDGTTATFVAVPAGTLLPIQVTKVKDAATTATDIVGLY